MERRKSAWVYCAIDAPEDTHGVLKEQYRQLCDYASQMGFEVAGSSSDLGYKPLWERHGFRCFVDAVQNGIANVLLIVSRHCLSHFFMQLVQLQMLTRNYELEIYSPVEGQIRINDNPVGKV